ncbi:MAG: hypothetical protein GX459_03130 [Bacteroidales bacterium]|nr:hypothetical protein [Bacteroidales bacterium]
MKVKVNQELKDVKDLPIKKSEGGNLTLKDVIITSVLSPMQGDDQKVKFDKYEIYKKVKDDYVGGEVELTAEEITLIKKCIGQLQPPLILGQAFEILEGKL